MLIPEEELSTKTYTNFIPKTNMSNLFNRLPNNTLLMNIKHLGIHHDIKFTDFRQATKSLDEVEHMINSEEERQKNYIETKHHSKLIYITMALASLSIALILIIYIMIKCKHADHTEMYSRICAGQYAIQAMQARALPSPR